MHTVGRDGLQQSIPRANNAGCWSLHCDTPHLPTHEFLVAPPTLLTVRANSPADLRVPRDHPAPRDRHARSGRRTSRRGIGYVVAALWRRAGRALRLQLRRRGIDKPGDVPEREF